MSNLWIFSEEKFDHIIRTKKKKHVVKSFVTVYFELPFSIPIQDEDYFTFYYKEKLIAFFPRQKVNPLNYKGTDNFLNTYTTDVEIVYFISEQVEEKDSEPYAHWYLDFSVEVVNYIIRVLCI